MKHAAPEKPVIEADITDGETALAVTETDVDLKDAQQGDVEEALWSMKLYDQFFDWARFQENQVKPATVMDDIDMENLTAWSYFAA